MNEEEIRGKHQNKGESQPSRIHLPGFICDDDIGLGDAIKRATSAIGIPPCGDCARRATALNNWLVFSGSRQSRRRI